MTAQANLPNKFTGKEWDDDFGLNWNYFGARYYDPVVGRWLGVDPIRNGFVPSDLIDLDVLSESPFVYVSNNPLLYIDENGEIKLRTFFRGVGLIISGTTSITLGSAVTSASAGATFASVGAASPVSSLGLGLGAFLISTGIAEIGVGAADIVNSFQDKITIGEQFDKGLLDAGLTQNQVNAINTAFAAKDLAVGVPSAIRSPKVLDAIDFLLKTHEFDRNFIKLLNDLRNEIADQLEQEKNEEENNDGKEEDDSM